MSIPAPAKSTPPARSGFALLLAAMLVVPIAALFVLRAALGPTPDPAPVAAPTTESAAPPAPPKEEPVDRTPEVRGRILDESGDPAGGAAVRLVSPSPPYRVLRETKADGEGGFSFTQVHAPRVRVVADQGTAGVVTSAELHPAPGQTVEVTLVLSAGRAVQGVVVDGEGKPVAGALLSIEGTPWAVRTATSDEQGAFVLSAVPEEARSIAAVARGFRTAHVEIPGRDGGAQALAPVTVRVRLVAAAEVAGVVTDAEGNPARARVTACEGQPEEVKVTAAEDGAFVLPASSIGCDVYAADDEHAPSDAVTVAEGRRLSLRMKPGGAIEGVVVDERGGPVRAFKVGIESFSAARGKFLRGGSAQTIDDRRGGFRFDKLAPGTYVLSASSEGKPPARSDPVDVAGGATTRGVRIVVAQGGTVAGRVFDEKHAPLADVELRFDAVSSVLDSSAETRTDGSGSYRLQGAPQGPFTVRVQKDGYRLRLLSGLRVDAHGTLPLDVTLTGIDAGGGLEYAGIGATLQPTPDGVALGAVFPGGPAEKAGLRAGDRIVQIDGEDTSGMSMAVVLQMLRGPAKTNVGVSALRPESGETMDLVIAREAIVR